MNFAFSALAVLALAASPIRIAPLAGAHSGQSPGYIDTAVSNQPRHGSRPSAARADGSPRYDIAAMDVAGIRLGMTADKVRDSLLAKGFKVSERKAYRTFATDVAREAQTRNRPAPPIPEIAGPEWIEGVDADRNRVRVDFMQMRAGPAVSSVTLTFDPKTNDAATLQADILRRYGLPTASFIGILGHHWCDTRDGDPCQPGNAITAPKLIYDPHFYTLLLTDWNAMNERRKAEISSQFAAPTNTRQKSLIGS